MDFVPNSSESQSKYDHDMDGVTFSLLIDGTDATFLHFCADHDLGYVKSLHNHILATYNYVVQAKEKLIKKCEGKTLSEDSEEVKTLNGFYAVLLRLEHKALLCKQVEDERLKMFE